MAFVCGPSPFRACLACVPRVELMLDWGLDCFLVFMPKSVRLSCSGKQPPIWSPARQNGALERNRDESVRAVTNLDVCTSTVGAGTKVSGSACPFQMGRNCVHPRRF